MALTFMERGENLKIQKAIEEKEIKTWRTNRIGPSMLGNQCDRYIWYKWRWVKQFPITPRQQRLFGRGNQEEPIVYAELEEAGVKILSKQTKITFAFGYGAGKDDGNIINVPDAPKTVHILEIKTSNDKNFQKIKKSGVKIAKKDHYLQFHIYMVLEDIHRTLYICTNKNDDERHYERIKDDGKTGQLAILRAEHIVRSMMPPLRCNDDQEKFPCSWTVRATGEKGGCEFRGICFQNDPVEQNCRTCKSVNLLGDGVWSCGKKKDKILSHPATKKQRKKGKESDQIRGCKKWEINPGL